MLSSRSQVWMILDSILLLSDRSAGIGKFLNSKSLLMACTWPKTVAEQEWQLMMRFSIKQASICSYPYSFPQASGIFLIWHQFRYLACLNHSVSILKLIVWQFSCQHCFPNQREQLLTRMVKTTVFQVRMVLFDFRKVITKWWCSWCVRFFESQNLVCNLVGGHADPLGVDPNLWADHESTVEMSQGLSYNRLLACVSGPVLCTNIVSNTKYHWMGIFNWSIFQIGSKCATLKLLSRIPVRWSKQSFVPSHFSDATTILRRSCLRKVGTTKN